MNICLTAGGTGGHIYPALALGDELIKQGHTIFYIGNKGKMEERLVSEKPYTFLPIDNEGLKPGLKAKLKGITSQFKAILTAKKYLKENNIDMVISFGGYVTFPACYAAKKYKIPYLIHEQNSVAGKANKMVQKDSAGIIVCFEEVIKQFNHPDIRFLGNPRASIAAKVQKDDTYLDSLGLSASLPIVYFVMGSLGSESMSQMVMDYLLEHPIDDYQFVISAGRQVESMSNQLKKLKNVFVYESVDQIQLLKHSELVISRAGATSIAEITASLTPAIYVPSPYVVANHQYYNALELKENGAALLIEEKELSAQILFDHINELLNDKDKLNQMSQNCQKFSNVDAIEKIIEWINEVHHDN